ncbi:MAG: DUF3846 domain-containing protein [Clostridia bacterium]|nr:DUF3846 domain-containing protein [Clostridia bacterium]
MKILVVEPLKEPYEKEIDGTLETMQEIVGGLIQAIYPFDHPEIALICNDDGKLMKLPLNRALFDMDGKIVDIIAGTFFLCSAPTDSENFGSLTDEQIEEYKTRFEALEIYITR